MGIITLTELYKILVKDKYDIVGDKLSGRAENELCIRREKAILSVLLKL